MLQGAGEHAARGLQGAGGREVQGTGDVLFLPFPVEGLAPLSPGVSAGPMRWGRSPPAPQPAGSSTAPRAKATPSCPRWAPDFVRGRVLSSSSQPGQHPGGHSSAAHPVPLGQETQPRGRSCPEPLPLAVASTFPPWRGVSGAAPHARSCVWMQTPCTCLPRGCVRCRWPRVHCGKGDTLERLRPVGVPRKNSSQPNSLTLSLLLSSGWKSIGDRGTSLRAGDSGGGHG